MAFPEITKAFSAVALRYKEYCQVAYDYIDAEMHKKMKAEPIQTDPRDFLPLVMIMGVEGDTAEERAQDIRNKIDHLVDVFSNSDRSVRKEYLDKFYDLADSFDPHSADMESEADMEKLFQCMLMDQAIAEKRNENPEYFNARYNTPESLAIFQAKQQYLTSASTITQRKMHAVGHPLVSRSTLPVAEKHTPNEILYTSAEYIRLNRDRIIQQEGMPVESNVVEVPITDAMVGLWDMKMEDAKVMNHSGQEMLDYYFSSILAENLMNSEKKEMQGYKEAKFNRFVDTVYIDGKPYEEFLKELGVKSSDLMNSGIICTALVNGRHNVDVVQAHRDEKGVMQYKAITIKPVLTPWQEQHRKEVEKDYLKKNYSWIRRTLFNWWPFRIFAKPQDPNSAKAAERRASICENLKGRIETAINRIEEEKRQTEERDRRNAERKAKLDGEKKRLDDSALQWDENSVLGILGKQVVGSYNRISYAIMSKSEKECYGAICEDLAKQVLYSQLMLERAGSEDGSIGPIEQSLMGDGKKETIENNIKQSVETLAKEDILKDFFMQKASGDNKLTRGSYEDMIIKGGCNMFTAEYIVHKNGVMEEKRAAEAAKTNELENAKGGQQQEMGKNPVN